MITRGDWTEDSISSGTYTIVIDNFKKKLAKAKAGERSSTEKFSVNWSKFTITLYINGNRENSRGYVSLFLFNKSDWMVRVKDEISAKVSLKKDFEQYGATLVLCGGI